MRSSRVPVALWLVAGAAMLALAAAEQSNATGPQFNFSNTLGDHAVLQSPVRVTARGCFNVRCDQLS